MSTKHRINPDDIKITPDDSIVAMAAKASFRAALRHTQASEARAAEKAKQPLEPRGLDFLGAERPKPR